MTTEQSKPELDRNNLPIIDLGQTGMDKDPVGLQVEDILAAEAGAETALVAEGNIHTAITLLQEYQMALEAAAKQLMLYRQAKPEGIRQRLSGVLVGRWHVNK